MQYIIKTVDGATIPITEKQYTEILEAEANGQQRVFVKGAAIRLNTCNFYPEHFLEQKEGYLHDGTKVIKKFGEWRDARNPDLRLDASYYPEIVRDEVYTPSEWKKRRETPNLPSGEALQIEEGSRSDGEAGLHKIGDVVEKHNLAT